MELIELQKAAEKELTELLSTLPLINRELELYLSIYKAGINKGWLAAREEAYANAM